MKNPPERREKLQKVPRNLKYLFMELGPGLLERSGFDSGPKSLRYELGEKLC